MNIDDVSETPTLEHDQVFPSIFKRQLELAHKYTGIEVSNGFWHPDVHNPPHIDNPKMQHWVKDMFWRTTEEIAEAFEVLEEAFQTQGDWRQQWESNHNLRHVYEEIADALHFLVEVSAVLKVDPTLITEIWTICDLNELAPPSYIRSLGADVIFRLGLTANCLKNKPWKSTHMTTDASLFFAKLVKSWYAFVSLLKGLDLRLPEVYDLYHKKNTVNQFRQHTNY